MTSILLLSFLCVLFGPALEGCRSASVGDTSGAKPPEADEEHISNRVHQNAGKVGENDDYNMARVVEFRFYLLIWYELIRITFEKSILSCRIKNMDTSTNMKTYIMKETENTGKFLLPIYLILLFWLKKLSCSS